LLAFAVDYRNPLRDVDAGGSYDVLTAYTNNGTQGNDWQDALINGWTHCKRAGDELALTGEGFGAFETGCCLRIQLEGHEYA
jgi:hypothetical protein